MINEDNTFKHDANLTIGQAVTRYLDSQGDTVFPVMQAELQRFAQWFRRDRPLADITPVRLASYGASVSTRDPEGQNKIDAVRGFLAYTARNGMTGSNLSAHIKPKKAAGHSRVRVSATEKSSRESQTLTSEGYAGMQQELEQLKENRPAILDEIRRAAADKDFRENAPLHAARERLGYIDGRIKELESILKTAIIAARGNSQSHRVVIGCEVCVSDVSSGDQMRVTIVGAKEYAPGQGKISCVSPIGKAMMGKMRGDIVDVSIPDGKVRYRIESVNA